MPNVSRDLAPFDRGSVLRAGRATTGFAVASLLS